MVSELAHSLCTWNPGNPFLTEISIPSHTGHLPKPQILLDRTDGVYLQTENVTLTCTVETHCSDKTFNIYKDGQHSNLPPVSTRDKSARFSFAALNQGGLYQCYYWCQSEGSSSPVSESVRVTITGEGLGTEIVNISVQNHSDFHKSCIIHCQKMEG